MKFGLSQIWKKTPMFISRLKRALNFFIASIGALSSFVAEWFNMTDEHFMKMLFFILLVVNTVGIMFGVDPVEEDNDKPKND